MEMRKQKLPNSTLDNVFKITVLDMHNGVRLESDHVALHL